MPLIATELPPNFDDNRKAIVFWMRDKESAQPLRVFVTYEALWQLDTSQMRDPEGAFATFKAKRQRIEASASSRYDLDGPDEGASYQGQPVLTLRSMDLADDYHSGGT
jgi:hypothetical protein